MTAPSPTVAAAERIMLDVLAAADGPLSTPDAIAATEARVVARFGRDSWGGVSLTRAALWSLTADRCVRWWPGWMIGLP